MLHGVDFTAWAQSLGSLLQEVGSNGAALSNLYGLAGFLELRLAPTLLKGFWKGPFEMALGLATYHYLT